MPSSNDHANTVRNMRFIYVFLLCNKTNVLSSLVFDLYTLVGASSLALQLSALEYGLFRRAAASFNSAKENVHQNIIESHAAYTAYLSVLWPAVASV